MKDELVGKIMTKYVELREKTSSYLTDEGSGNKKTKDTKKCVWKKLLFENYKNSLEATRIENKMNYLEKNKTNIDSLKKNHKKFILDNKLMLKTQQS